MVILVLNVLLFVLFVFSNQCWDLGKGFRIPEVYRTGYTVIGLSVITSIAMAFFL